jgi:hypothetical protein
MTTGDLLVERGAQRLQQLAGRAARRGDGIGEWLSEELANDAAFLRKLKPSLIAARARGQAPGKTEPGPSPEPAPSVKTQPGARSAKRRRRRRGPPPVVVVGIALAAGILAAKVIAWRGNENTGD